MNSKRKINGRGKAIALQFCLVLAITTCHANAIPIDVNIYNSTTIDSGEYGTVNIYDTPPDQTIVTMTGGSAEWILSYDSSVFDFQNGDISMALSVHNDSNALMSGGSILDFELFDSSVAHISGGNITGHLATFGTSIAHIYGQNFSFTPQFSNGPGWITGNWTDNTPFSIYYRNYEPFPGTHLFLHEIPEPCTISLFGIGCLILRRRAKISHR
jgi:hypothetical protein